MFFLLVLFRESCWSSRRREEYGARTIRVSSQAILALDHTTFTLLSCSNSYVGTLVAGLQNRLFSYDLLASVLTEIQILLKIVGDDR
jgi:hypothetical protein